MFSIFYIWGYFPSVDSQFAIYSREFLAAHVPKRQMGNASLCLWVAMFLIPLLIRLPPWCPMRRLGITNVVIRILSAEGVSHLEATTYIMKKHVEKEKGHRQRRREVISKSRRSHQQVT
jgi:hypothetical protein